MRWIQRKSGRVIGRRANVVIETALVLPMLALLGFGTVEYGYWFYVAHTLQGAARDGARAAIVATSTNTDVNNAVAAAMTAAGLQSSGYTVTTSPTTISGVTTGTNITVTVQCTWGTVGIRPMNLISSTKAIKGTAVMYREGS